MFSEVYLFDGHIVVYTPTVHRNKGNTMHNTYAAIIIGVGDGWVAHGVGGGVVLSLSHFEKFVGVQHYVLPFLLV